MTQWVNVGGVWKKVVGEYTKVAGVWKRSAASFVNVGAGSPRFYSTLPTMTFLGTVGDTANRASYTFNNIALGAEGAGRRFFAYVMTDYGPTGNLDLTATWTVNGVNYTNTIVNAALAPGFAITPDFTYYTGRYVSYISAVIPTGTLGNFTITISTNGAISYGVSVSIYSMIDTVSATPFTTASGAAYTYTFSNLEPGSIIYAFANNNTGAYPVITAQTLSQIGTDDYARNLSGNIYSRVYGFRHAGTGILASETLTLTASNPSTSNRFHLVKFR